MDKFHAHLDVCQQCREHPFDLCPIGAPLLVAAAQEPPPDMGFLMHTGRAPSEPRRQTIPMCTEPGKAIKRAFINAMHEGRPVVLKTDYAVVERRVMATLAAAAARRAPEEAERPDPEYLCASCGCETNTTMDKPCGACGSVRVALFSALKPHIGPDWRSYFKPPK